MWLFFLAIHLVGFSGYNLVLRKALIDNVDRWTLATIMQTAIAIPMVLAVLVAPPQVAIYDSKSLGLIALIIPLTIALHISNVMALKYLEASVYSVLYNLRILFTTILGIVFLNEDIIPLQILGGLLIFLAILTVRQKGSKSLTRRGLEWGVVASIVISLLNLFEKELINIVGYLPYAIPVHIAAVIIMWVVLLARKQKVSLRVFQDSQTQLLMVLRVLSAYGFGLAFYYGGKLSVSTYISSLGVIITVILGIILLGENDYLKQKIIATCMAVAGLTCILIASLL